VTEHVGAAVGLNSKANPGSNFLRSLWSRTAARVHHVWHNQVVGNEREFAAQFRNQAFADARIAAWVAAIVGSALMLDRTVIRPWLAKGISPEKIIPASQEDILSGIILFWAAPMIFAAASVWSRRNYQWVLSIVFGLRFIRLGIGVLEGTRDVPSTAMSVLVLTTFVALLLRLPFKHALHLSLLSLLFISAISSYHFGFYQWLPALVPIVMVAGLALFASWRAEGRERRLFNQRQIATEQANLAAEQAALAGQAAALAANKATAAENAEADAKAQSWRAQSLLEQLQAVYAQRELLVRAIHHDANQPLALIGQVVFRMEQRAFSDDAFAAFRKDLATIATGTSDLDRLLRSMHNLAKLGDFVPRYEPVSLNKLLLGIAERFNEAANSKGLELIVRTRTQGELFLWTDAEAVTRMLANLVSNAIKYTIRGRVFVGCVKQKNLLRIDVLDSGVGIPEEKKNEIYKEFVRLEQEGVKDAKGLGLGLAIVTMFRDRLDGHYVDHASQVGLGSRFSLTVPVASLAPEVGQIPSDVPQALPTNKVYALLVEDDKPLRISLISLLHSAGYDVHDNVKAAGTVGEVREIFAKFSVRPPNVVISDYRLLDGETGDDVIGLVDEIFPWATVPVIIYTAEISPELRRRRDHVYVLAKSSDPVPLLSLMQRAIWTAKQAEASRRED
jgi:signal transduction histidine kinase